MNSKNFLLLGVLFSSSLFSSQDDIKKKMYEEVNIRLAQVGFDVNKDRIEGFPVVLGMILSLKNFDLYKVFLEKGGDVYSVEKSSGQNALHIAAQEVTHPEIIKDLVSKGIDVNSKITNESCYGGGTPLHEICQPDSFEKKYQGAASQKRDAINILIKLGARLEEIDNEGRTPLHQAANCRDVIAIKEFVSAGANRSALDRDGRTPLETLIRSAQISRVSLDPQMVALLIPKLKSNL